ncbi:MAG: hypothetical protein U0W24_06805 [Bacteroidales bacterium]
MENCTFCEIVNGKREKEQVVYECQDFIVITDKLRKTRVDGIYLVIPKEHKRNILELSEIDNIGLIKTINLVTKAVQ